MKIVGQLGGVGKRVLFNFGIEEELEWIDGDEVGNEVDLDREFVCLLRENEAGALIVVGVQLPIEYVSGGGDVHRIAENGGSTMKGGAQLNDLRSKQDFPFIPVMSSMIQCNLYSHPTSCDPALFFEVLSRPSFRAANPSAARLLVETGA